MNGFYSLWTAPYYSRKGQGDFFLQDYDLLTLLLSVAVYQRYNGKTRMYADDAACGYLSTLGLEGYFARGVVSMEAACAKELAGVDPRVFWAGGKLVALGMEPMPSVMIDTDLIIWRGLEERLRPCSVAVIHREELNPEIYPPPERFAMQDGYRFPKGWDFTVLPANTAMLFLRDAGFRDYYVSEALRFMRMSAPTTDNLCPMVFAEQRVLTMCAAARGLTVSSYVSRIEQLREQDLFTHVWGHKNVLKFNMDERRSYCRRVVARLRREYPQEYAYVERIEELSEYLC